MQSVLNASNPLLIFQSQLKEAVCKYSFTDSLLIVMMQCAFYDLLFFTFLDSFAGLSDFLTSIALSVASF